MSAHLHFPQRARKQEGSIPIHEQPHLDDRVWPVFFAFSVFFTAIFLFNLKVVIRAVIIEDFIISFSKEMAVFVDFCLNEVAFRTKDIQCTVYIMEPIGSVSLKTRRCFIGRLFAARFQDSCID